MGIFNEAVSVVIHDDDDVSNNPSKRIVDWRRVASNVTVSNGRSDQYAIPPGTSQILFSGTRTHGIDGTTAFQLSLNAVNGSVYRMESTSGTSPAFRTDRALALNTHTVTVTVNNNATATFTDSGTGFTACQVGDNLFIPTTLTGDAALVSPFSVLNGGLWSIIGKTNSSVTVVRLPGQNFSAAAEVVTVTNSKQVQAYSSAGVQVGDTVELSAGFSSVSQRPFIVSSVTPTRIEFVSTEALPLESGISPGAAGVAIYSQAKRYVRVEADQEVVVRFNGDTSNSIKVAPRAASDKNAVGWLELWGHVFSIEVVNRSTSNAVKINLITCE